MRFIHPTPKNESCRLIWRQMPARWGAHVIKATTIEAFQTSLGASKKSRKKQRLSMWKTDRYAGIPNYDSWWDVPIAEVADSAEIKEISKAYQSKLNQERYYFLTPDGNRAPKEASILRQLTVKLINERK